MESSDADDIGMAKTRLAVLFVGECLKGLGIAFEFVVQNLDCNVTCSRPRIVENEIARFIHGAHAAFAQHALKLELSGQCRADADFAKLIHIAIAGAGIEATGAIPAAGSRATSPGAVGDGQRRTNIEVDGRLARIIGRHTIRAGQAAFGDDGAVLVDISRRAGRRLFNPAAAHWTDDGAVVFLFGLRDDRRLDKLADLQRLLIIEVTLDPRRFNLSQQARLHSRIVGEQAVQCARELGEVQAAPAEGLQRCAKISHGSRSVVS